MEIVITGIDELVQRLGRAQANDVLRRPMVASLALLHGQLAAYPAPPVGSSYRRTGTLGRSWTTTVTPSSDGITGEIGNNVRYAPYVQGGPQSDPDQAWMHQGRWQTDEQVMLANEARIRALFSDAVLQALNG